MINAFKKADFGKLDVLVDRLLRYVNFLNYFGMLLHFHSQTIQSKILLVKQSFGLVDAGFLVRLRSC